MATETKVYEKRWIGMIFIGISLIVISLDNTVLNVALPSISRELGASASELQWIIDAYILVFAALLLTMGSLGDRNGRKRLLQIGLIIFGIGSLGAALATSTGMLIATRAFTGIGAAAIMPATLSIITNMFSDPKERTKAIAVWAATFGLGVGIGPVIGGWLVESYSWNAVFFVNLPIVVIALAGGYFFLPESFDKEAPKADVPGVLLSIVGLFALVYGIIEAGMSSWTDGTVLIAFGIAAVFLGAFAIWESRAPNAMLPMRFFKNMSFTGANTAIALVFFGMMGSMFFFSQYFQSVQGLTAFEAGLRVLPISLFLVVAAGVSTRLSARFGIKLTVGVGILFAAAAMLYFSQVIAVDSPYSVILAGYLLLGIGMGTAMTPATDSIMGSVPAVKAGIGSAMNDTTRQLGGAMGVAILGTVMNSVYLSEITSLEQAPFFSQLPEQAYAVIQSSIQGALIVAKQVPVPQIAQVITDTAGEAFVQGMTQAMFIASLIMFAAALVTFAILPTRIQRADKIAGEVDGVEAVETAEPTTAPLPAPNAAAAD